MRISQNGKRVIAALAGACVVVVALPHAAYAAVTPPTASISVVAGEHGTVPIKVDIPAQPKPAETEVEIAIDTTGSMGGPIATAKAQATQLVTDLTNALAPNVVRFAVVEFKDKTDVPEYAVHQAMTTSAAAVQTAINGLAAGGGGDAPEAHNVVFRNSHSPSVGGPIGWSAASRKFVVVISDAQPHGAGTAGIANCNDTTADPNGLNTATELAAMKSTQRTLFMVRANTFTPLSCYQSLADRAYKGGAGADLSANLAGQITSLVMTGIATVADVYLAVGSATPAPAVAGWIGAAPPSYANVVTPASRTFSLVVSPPLGTPTGTYTFDVYAEGDGVDLGHMSLRVTVVRPATRLDVDPALVSVDVVSLGNYLLTASGRLTQASNGNPISGRPVSFSSSMGGFICTAVTDAAGQASCAAPIDDELFATLSLGYQGFFGGDSAYAPSAGTSDVVTVTV